MGFRSKMTEAAIGSVQQKHVLLKISQILWGNTCFN